MIRRAVGMTLGAAAILCAAVAPAGAQLLEHKDLSLATALAIATAAADHCKAQGFTVSVAVVGRNAEVIVHLRGDGAPPHSMENSYRRAYTARTYKQPSGAVEQRVRKDPGDQLVHLHNVMAAQGGLPVVAGGDVIGAVAVSGSPDGDKDEACAKVGLDKVASVLR
jgi:uncharacterized protein GlcG (DUF336 family)